MRKTGKWDDPRPSNRYTLLRAIHPHAENPMTTDPSETEDLPDVDPLDTSRHELLYKGAGGQLAVMSEFLMRLLNVAVPVVDVGNDVFVVQESSDIVTRIQVKYAQAQSQKNRTYVAMFGLPWEQLAQFDEPSLVYVLAVRFGEIWSDFIVIRRSILKELNRVHSIGTENFRNGERSALILRLVFDPTTDPKSVRAKRGFDLTPFRNAFDPWPPPVLGQT